MRQLDAETRRQPQQAPIRGCAHRVRPGDFALARLNTDGSLDSGFSGDGMLTIGFGQDDAAASVALQPDGKIVVGGSSVEFSASFPSDFALARVGAGGSIDDTFSADGTVTIDFGQNDGAASVDLQPDGKIVAAGSTGGGVAVDFAAARVEGGDGPQPQRTLTVSTVGTGTVTGPGISCPGDCTESYADDQNVTLSASPASGSTFNGFSGSCTGANCSLTMDADKAVTATFGTIAAPADTDGDGVPDASDDCPAEAGPASNDGCPVSTPPDEDPDPPPSGGDTTPPGGTTPPFGTTPPPTDLGPTEDQIEAVLADQVKTAAKDLKQLGLDKLLEKEVFKAQVTALTPGTFAAKLKGAIAAKKAVTIAKGSKSFAGIDKGKVKLKLTKAGEKLLKKAKKAKDAVTGTFELKFSADEGNAAKDGAKVKLK